MEKIELKTTVSEEHAGQRLDRVVSMLLPEYSRSRIQGWIKTGDITVNKKHLRQRDIVHDGDTIHINVEFEVLQENQAEDIPLDIIFEDEALIIVNKPAGLVVHPGAGNPANTLVNALLNHDGKLNLLPRAGIVHRLDKDTTGLLLIARTPAAHSFLVEKLQAREIKREYLALVCGVITAGNTIETNIGRHPTQRTRMAVTRTGKEAITHYRIEKKFKHYSLLRVMLETGRTHQIRVHMSHLKHPIVGDPIYGRHQSIVKGISTPVREAITSFKRQALHAFRLCLPHPVSGEIIEHQVEPPADISLLLNVLEQHDQN